MTDERRLAQLAEKYGEDRLLGAERLEFEKYVLPKLHT